MTLTSKKPLWWFAAILAAILYYVYYEVSLKKMSFSPPVTLRIITDEEAARTAEITVNAGDPPTQFKLRENQWTPVVHFRGGERVYTEYPRKITYECFFPDGRSVVLTATAYSCPRDETGKEYPASPSRLVRFRGPEGDLLKVTCR